MPTGILILHWIESQWKKGFKGITAGHIAPMTMPGSYLSPGGLPVPGVPEEAPPPKEQGGFWGGVGQTPGTEVLNSGGNMDAQTQKQMRIGGEMELGQWGQYLPLFLIVFLVILIIAKK